MHHFRIGRAERRHRLLGGLLLCLIPLAGCSNTVDGERHEAHPLVELTYDEAARKATARVPGGRVLRLDLRKESTEAPEWRCDLVTEDRKRHVVTLPATGAQVPGEQPSARPSGRVDAHRADLLNRAALLPEEAVRKVSRPGFDKVESVELAESSGEPSWTVDLVSGEEAEGHRYEIDAVSGEVLHRSEGR